MLAAKGNWGGWRALMALLLVSGLMGQAPLVQAQDEEAALRSQMARVAQQLAAQSAQLSPRERAIAEAQLGLAQELLRQANEPGGATRGPDLRHAQSVVTAAEAVSTSAGGVRRAVQVTVTPVREGASAPVLEVYALPQGLFNYAYAVPEAKLRTLLQQAVFIQRTSPAADALYTEGDYMVWIAPPNRLEDVLQLLRRKAVTMPRLVRAKAALPVQLSFSESEQVVLAPLPAAAASAKGGQP